MVRSSWDTVARGKNSRERRPARALQLCQHQGGRELELSSMVNLGEPLQRREREQAKGADSTACGEKACPKRGCSQERRLRLPPSQTQSCRRTGGTYPTRVLTRNTITPYVTPSGESKSQDELMDVRV